MTHAQSQSGQSHHPKSGKSGKNSKNGEKHLMPDRFFKEVQESFPADFMTQDPEELKVLGKDWTSVFLPRASAAVFPRTTQEVSRFLALCSQHQVAVVPSGGRTGLAGGAVAANGEVVLSLSRMNQIGSVDPVAQTVRVQAGAVTEAVHQHCASLGLTWPVDFASKGSSQVGGNIATNAGGVKVIRYGLTRHWVLGLQVVTMQGDVLELNGALEKNNTGVDLRQLFIGSEGTLGVVTEATLKLTRLPGLTDVFFFAVDGISGVLDLFREARRGPFSIMAFEFLTQNCLDAVTQARGLKSPFPSLQGFQGQYVLLEIERPALSIDGSHEGAQSKSPELSGYSESLDAWLANLYERGCIRDGVLAQSPREAKELWSLREGITESLAHKGFVYKNDIALPIANLNPFIEEMYPLFVSKRSDLQIYLFGHIGDGNLHVNTMKPEGMGQKEFIHLCHNADEDLFALVKKYQGSVSAEHGIGLLKKHALHFSRSPEEIALMKNLKKVFDPQGLLNPGKIV